MSEPAATETRTKRVVFFEDRAEVTRVGKATLTEGRQWVRLAGPTVLLDDRTVQARALSGQAKVLSARVVRRTRNVNDLPQDEAAKLTAALAEAVAQAQLVQAKHERLGVRTNYLAQLMQQWAARLAQVPRPGEDSPVSEWAQAWQTLVDRDDDYLARQNDIVNELDDANDKHVQARQRFHSANVSRTVFECFIEVQLDASTMDDIELEVKYRTPCALWRPEHMARLDQDAKNPRSGEVEWTTWGVAWQRTGEDWDGVEVAFSTARPAQVADAPEIDDDVLTKRKKTAEERKQVVVQVREEMLKEVGTRAMSGMPGVDDGGKPLEFSPQGRFALPSNGQPTRVEIDRRSLKAKVSRVLMPERAQTAYLKADLIWDSAAPVLAGPLRLARGGAVVGRSRVKFVGAGEKFETGFGPEDGVRCKRAQHEDREKAKLTGSQTIVRKVTLRLSNLGDSAREIDVLERIPVSEIEGLEVKLTEGKDWQLDKDGYLRRTVKLEARGQATLEYEYEIKAKGNVVLPF